MISRKTSRLITDIYLGTFAYSKRISTRYGSGERTTFVLRSKELYEFFYERDYDVWFLQIIAKYNRAYHESLRTLLLGMHTGETIHATSKSSWEECQAYGQQLLLKLARDIIREYQTKNDQYGIFAPDSKVRKEVKALISQLEIDGYVYSDNNLYAAESSVIDDPAEQEYLEVLSKSLILTDVTTIKHHLDFRKNTILAANTTTAFRTRGRFSRQFLARLLPLFILRLTRKPYLPRC